MKTRTIFASLTLTILMFLLASIPAVAGNNTVVYNNGLPDGNDAWTINYGFTVSDSFTLSSPANVNHVDFWAWLFPGDIVTSVNWTIYTMGPNAKEQKIWGTGTANVTFEDGGDCYSPPFSNGCKEGFSFPAIAMPAGTYWLKLGCAQVPSGDPVYWAESGGPSIAYENSVGTIPSEAFDIVDPPADGGKQ